MWRKRNSEEKQDDQGVAHDKVVEGWVAQVAEVLEVQGVVEDVGVWVEEQDPTGRIVEEAEGGALGQGVDKPKWCCCNGAYAILDISDRKWRDSGY